MVISEAMKRKTIILVLATCIIESQSLLDFSSLHRVADVQKQNIHTESSIRHAGGVYPRNVTRSLKSNKVLKELLKHTHIDKDSDWQRAQNCGPGHSHIFLEWKPKVIDPEGNLQVKMDIRAPVSYSHGTVRVDVYMLEDTDPIFTIMDTIACGDIQKVAPFIQCPLQKCFPLKRKFTIDELTKLPVGDYVLVVHVSNENNELFACLNGTIYIEPKR